MMKWTNTSILDCRQGAVRAVRYNVDGCYALTAGSDRTVKLWNPSKGTCLQTFVGHGLDVMDCRGSSDNAFICTASKDKTCTLFEVETGKSIRKWRSHAGPVLCSTFNEDGSLVLSGGVDGKVCIWDVKNRGSRDPLQTLEEPTDAVTSVTCSDHEILVSSLDGKVRRYDLRVGKMSQDDAGAPASRACFTSDGKCIILSCLGGVLHLLDKYTGQCLQQYRGHLNVDYYLDICLGAHDMRVFSGSEDGNVFLWSLVEAKVLHKMKHPVEAPVHSLTHHPEENTVMTACKGIAYLWNLDEED
ncbi:WD repeat domain-containing protein 83 [Galendromus occidentalis]|uniref:WD repeat domain-containing protein 83 n=1 Tax=Galendromus occidentalis TaxID=34638 RepID=A0AAJ7SFN9_9ACAR|nr:WD repeat domain-containing protein 83 [Galendromus occidentalis]